MPDHPQAPSKDPTAGPPGAVSLADAFSSLLSQTNVLPNLHYWEQNAEHRITRMSGHPDSNWVVRADTFIGKTPWQLGGTPQGCRNWDEARAVFEAQQPVTDLVVKYTSPSGEATYISHSGEPRFDTATGHFMGHHGVFRDVTRRVAIERRLVVERQTADLLSQTPKLRDAVRGLAQVFCEALNWRCAGYWELGAPGQPPRCLAHWPPAPAGPAADASPFAAPPAGASDPVLQASERGTALWLTDLSAAPHGERIAQAMASGLRCALLVPVSVQGRAVGVLELFGPHLELEDPQMTECCRYASTILGQLIERQRLDDERLQFRAAVDALPDMVYLVDRDTMRFVYVNQAACDTSQYTLEEHLQLGPHDLLPQSRAFYEKLYDELIAQPGQEGQTTESIGFGKGDRKAYVEVHRRVLRVGERWLSISISRDITSRKLAERAARRTARMYAALSATNEAIIHARTPDGLFTQICRAAVDGAGFLGAAVMLPQGDGAAGVVAHAGPAALRETHISLDAATPEGNGLAGTAFRTHAACIAHDFLADPRTQPWHEAAREAKIASAGAIPLLSDGRALGVLVLYSGDKRGFDDEVIKLLLRMAENTAFALDNIAREEERRKGQERITYLASHDALTGLPNRLMFSEHLSLAVLAARRYQRKFAVMYLDLDRFKLINDSLGHSAGDQLLQELSLRLKDCLRASDVIGRTGGDEFVVLVQEVEEVAQVATVARKLLTAALNPVVLHGQDCRVTASIGISMYPADAQDEQELMKNADLAMYHAKAEGKNNFQFFSPAIRDHSLERLTLESNLRNALERHEFSLHYQPKIDIHTNTITGVEALLRWNNPTLGSVSPAQFIPLAEETGLIIPIGRWVLRTACEQSAAWQRAGLPVVCMAVNLSARQFSDEDLVDDLATVLRDTGVAPPTLELEITEGMVITNPARAMGVLRQMKALGVRLALDDFGTGYSSLGQLKNFPVDTLKVDRSFIRDLPGNADDRAITEAIIAMGKSLCLNVIAEGVETIEQLEFLRQSACDEMQGFYFSKAIPADEFEAMLRARQDAT